MRLYNPYLPGPPQGPEPEPEPEKPDLLRRLREQLPDTGDLLLALILLLLALDGDDREVLLTLGLLFLPKGLL